VRVKVGGPQEPQRTRGGKLGSSAMPRPRSASATSPGPTVSSKRPKSFAGLGAASSRVGVGQKTMTVRNSWKGGPKTITWPGRGLHGPPASTAEQIATLQKSIRLKRGEKKNGPKTLRGGCRYFVDVKSAPAKELVTI